MEGVYTGWEVSPKVMSFLGPQNMLLVGNMFGANGILISVGSHSSCMGLRSNMTSVLIREDTDSEMKGV